MSKIRWQVITSLLCFWLLILVFMTANLYQSSDVNIEDHLTKALDELDVLRKQNRRLQTVADQLGEWQKNAGVGGSPNGQQKQIVDLKKRLKMAEEHMRLLQSVKSKPRFAPSSNSSGANEPLPEQLETLMKIENGVVELGFYLDSQLSQLRQQMLSLPVGRAKSDLELVVSHIESVTNNSKDQRNAILTDLYKESEASVPDGWYKKEAKELADIVQKRLRYLQNPRNCSTARKLICQLNKGCGFGCQLHHVTFCLIVAYGTQRTLVLKSTGWQYQRSGWQTVFQPVTSCPEDWDNMQARNWAAESIIANAPIVRLPIVDHLQPRPPFMPLAIPEDLAPRLLRLHGNPSVWWIGQFVRYLMRPQHHLQTDIDAMHAKLRFAHPIVGVHVRRTDKVGTEAAFHDISEYMRHVDAYYDRLEKRELVEKRRIYLATDEPSLLADTRNRFPNYEVIGENSFSRTAGLKSRYSDTSLRGIIMDIHFLSISDYLVCTFSSQVCRVAYEIMQTLHPNAYARFHSLDDIFYYGGQDAHDMIAIAHHRPQRLAEIELRPGDVVGIAGNHWDGYSKGVNRRTGVTGLFPSYKVRDEIKTARFPTYPNVT